MEKRYSCTTPYLTYLAEAVFGGVRTARDNTLITPPGMGIMAFILSLINTRELPYKPTDILNTCLGARLSKRVIYIPLNFENLEPESFSEQFLFALNNNPNLVAEFKPVDSVFDLYRIVTKLAREYTFIIILSTVPTPADLDAGVLRSLKFLQSLQADNFRIIYSFNKIDELNNDVYYRAFCKQVTYIKPFGLEEVAYITKQLYEKFAHEEPDPALIKKIFRYSGGLTAINKDLVLKSLNGGVQKVVFDDYSFKHLKQILPLLSPADKTDLQSNREPELDSYLVKTSLYKMPEVMAFLRSEVSKRTRLEDINAALTRTENNIFQYLLQHSHEIVSRDTVAQQIWGEESVDKYSDWTIDRHIANIRNKIKDYGILRTIKTRGFQFTPQASV